MEKNLGLELGKLENRIVSLLDINNQVHAELYKCVCNLSKKSVEAWKRALLRIKTMDIKQASMPSY